MIFITGGVRSGKSAFAERYALKMGAQKNYYYFATGVAFDEEMKKRIVRHQQDRNVQDIQWTTVEMQVEVPTQYTQLSTNDVVLFECVTTWLSNVLYMSEGSNVRSETIHHYIELLQKQLLDWQEQGTTIIIVSNELLDELPSKYEQVNLYRQLLGELHQWFVQQSNEAYEVQFQLIQRWK